VVQPAPAPRFSQTPAAAPESPRSDAEALLAELGYTEGRIAALRKAGAVS